MMTWWLWRAVQRPPYRHPLFQRSISPRLTPDTSPPDNRLLIVLMLFSAIFCCVFGATQVSSYVFTALFVPLAVSAPVIVLLVMFNGAAYGMILADRFSRIIHKERSRGSFDLIALLPAGALGASWILCLGVIYRGSKLSRINFQHTWAIRILPILVMSVYLYQLNRDRWDSNLLFILTSLYVLAQGVAFHIDDVQSILLSILMGILTPLYFRNRMEARAVAVAGYILLQAASYGAALFIAFNLLDALYVSFNLSGLLLPEISLPALRLLIFYGVRESIISSIWYILSRQLTADPTGEGLTALS